MTLTNQVSRQSQNLQKTCKEWWKSVRRRMINLRNSKLRHQNQFWSNHHINIKILINQRKIAKMKQNLKSKINSSFLLHSLWRLLKSSQIWTAIRMLNQNLKRILLVLERKRKWAVSAKKWWNKVNSEK